MTACQAEVESYCSQVTPGGGRLLACFAAHEDKLSGGCSKALYGFSTELEAFTRAMAFAANACYEDITRFCADVEGGEGRVADCLIQNQSEVSATRLLDNKEKVTPQCSQAMADVELEVVE